MREVLPVLLLVALEVPSPMPSCSVHLEQQLPSFVLADLCVGAAPSVPAVL